MSLHTPERSAVLASPVASVRGPVTWRSVLLGLIGVVFICGLTPYNDYVVANTFLVGNYLPIGLLLLFFVFSLVINGPLSRWAPSLALNTGEVSVAFAMAMVSCALPSSGLMRYLPANLVVFHNMAGSVPDYRELLQTLDLPDWVFPTTTVTDLGRRSNDPVIRDFIARTPMQADTFLGRLADVPWGAWAKPAAVWAMLLACLGGMILCMSTIVRAQWADNERLPFPLAGVIQSLIEQPERGQTLNPLLRSPLFWVAFGLVFLIHGTNALHSFFPRFVPEIPRGFDFGSVMNDAPLKYTEWYFKRQALYFSIIGLTFFLQSAVSFSLWFFIIVLQVVAMIYGSYELQLTGGMRADQNFGGVVAYALSILWIGRAHWVMVMRQMVGRRREGEAVGRYVPYPVAGWGLLACGLGAFVWLVAVGCSPIGAAALVVMMFMMFLVISRIVAETGIPFVQVNLQLFRFWTFLAGPGLRTTPTTFFFTAWFHGLFVTDMRESAAVFTTQAMRITDQGAYDGGDDAPARSAGGRAAALRRTWPVAACIVAALALGFVTSGAAMLYTEYTYAATLDRSATSPINGYATNGTGQPKSQVLEPSVDYARPGGTGAKDLHSPARHFAFGAGFTAFLAAMRLRFTAWPLHPVGFLLMNTYPMQTIWFSVFFGWLCKSIVVRFGGIDLFRALRPVFLGLIVGEAGAVAFWLVVNLVCVQFGVEYYQINILPG